MHTTAKKTTRLLLVALVVTLSGLVLASLGALAAPLTYNLCASDGTIMLPGAVVVNVWGFVQTTTCTTGMVTAATFPGPVLSVNEGDVVTINVTNALTRTISFEAPGVVFGPGPTDAPSGGSVTRIFTVTVSSVDTDTTHTKPGTYLYQSGGDAGRQEAMGLYGALIVRPSPAVCSPCQAYYTTTTTTTTYDVSATLVLSQIDPNFNAAPDTFTMTNYLATYWLVNGKAYPDTAPGITATVGSRVLLRYLNAGYDNTSMMLLGMHEQVLARDAHLLNNPFFANTETIPAGGTEDTIATMPSFAPPTINGFPLFNRNLHVTNGPACVTTGPCVPNPAYIPGGMLIFIHP